MDKFWLRKMIWSYIPLFLVVFSFLLIFFLQVIVEQNRQNAKETSEVFTAQLMQSVDVALKTVDRMVIRELLNNKQLAGYFESGNSDQIYLNYEVLKRLNELKQEMPLIDSFYLYRYSDGMVLSSEVRKNMDVFEDRAFARSIAGLRMMPYWTDARDYRELAFQNFKSVISVVHEAPVNSGTQGLFVINIKVSSIRATLSSLYDGSTTFVNLYGRNGQPIYSDNPQQQRKAMARLTSDYTGWTIESGMRNGLLSRSTSAFYSIWFVVGIFVFVSGLLLIIYITKVNYKPLEQLVVKLNHSLFSGIGSAGGVVAVDEFAFIDSAINNFVAQSKLAEREFSKSVMLKRKHAFSILINGTYEMEEWAERPFEGLKLPEFHTLNAIVIEIDNAEHTFFTYSARDRSLFKFVVSSVVNEMVQQSDTSIWLEWTSQTHLSAVIFQDNPNDLASTYESIVNWVSKNLKFTITIGIGRNTSSPKELKTSYEEACSFLHLKPVLGTNRIIRYSDAEHPHQKSEHEHLRTIHEISSAFRLGNERWKSLIWNFFHDIRTAKPMKAEIIKLFDYFLANLELHHSSGSKEEYQIIRQAANDARVKMETFDTLDEASKALYEVLEECYLQLQELRSPRSYYNVLQEIKDCIEDDYANPELSLDFLSDKFSISSKYLSRLFKEMFGENFLDFLSSVRIGAAKNLLLHSEDSIQEIGEKVGYPSAATFRRVFRKMEGASPQDYRTRMHK